ncbi:MAG TPA: endonuclease/exonuclease/phosphatase family protein [Bacteroidetes bacterium]|nr:endonuclease/exonuclease/phosphatase family protein [Bacteroidota bacterium]
MKYIFPVLLFAANTILAHAQNLKLMTYNMRLDLPSDGENAWPNRKDFFVKQLLDISPDIIGTQEGLPRQIDFIDQKLSNYSYIGIGRDGGKGKGEYCAIFYKKEKLKLIKSNTFWLSKTPEKKSKGWDAAYIRICTYGLFKDKKSGKPFWVFNTHLDNKGEQARRKGIRLICKKIKQLNNENHPVILMGDLNAEPDNKIIKRLSRKFIDAKVADKNPSPEMDATFNAFDFDSSPTRRIDYIFLEKRKFAINSYLAPRLAKNGKYPSDHFPVIVEVSILK